MSERDTASFVELVLAGEALAEDIDDFIDRWHNSPNDKRSIAEFLGLSENEYGLWVENPHSLSWVLMCKRQNISFESLDWNQAHQLAARAKGPEESERLIKWLKKNRTAVK
jgi:hypothetical protein